MTCRFEAMLVCVPVAAWNKGVDQHCWIKEACSSKSSDSRFVSGMVSDPTPIPSPGQYVRTLMVDNTTFLDAFGFFDGSDPTHGFVDFVDQHDALALGLVTLSDGQIMMKAETTDTTLKRRSVRVQTKVSLATPHGPRGQRTECPLATVDRKPLRAGCLS